MITVDKTCKKILDKMISEGKGTEYICTWGDELASFAASIGVPTEDVRAAVRYLKETGYLEFQMYHSSNGSSHSRGFFLSHRGLNWRYFRRKEVLDYIADKWVDFFAALIALLSLVISIAALTQ